METTATKNQQAIIYARLASHDKFTDLRLGDQIQTAKNLAAEHNLIVGNVISEVGSGSEIKQRAGLREVSGEAKAGNLSHVIVADMTRFLRGGKTTDWRHIGKAFAEGEVTVITDDKVYDFRLPETLDQFLEARLTFSSEALPNKGIASKRGRAADEGYPSQLATFVTFIPARER